MIPARLGSKRVPQKNIRLLNGKPLISYAIEAAIDSKIFDEIYVNSESDILGEIAQQHQVNFYKRTENLSSDKTINDEFLLDFMKNIDGDILVQLLPTSPLISAQEIREFVEAMEIKEFPTYVSVVNHQIAAVFEGTPVNFIIGEPHKSSQEMTPVQSYATVLMGWNYNEFFNNIKNYNCGYHGRKGNIGYHPIKGLSTIDIDNEEDFLLAEVALKYREGDTFLEKKYYVSSSELKEKTEIEVPQILEKDGVLISDFEHENLPIVQLEEIIASKDNSRSWCHRVINTENNSATLISQIPGEGNRRHYHPNWNEWWYIVKGQWIWEIEGEEFTVKPGQVVFINKGKIHKITATGNEPAIRLAVSRDRVPHIYPEEA